MNHSHDDEGAYPCIDIDIQAREMRNAGRAEFCHEDFMFRVRKFGMHPGKHPANPGSRYYSVKDAVLDS